MFTVSRGFRRRNLTSHAVGAGPVVAFPITRVRGMKLESGRGFLGGYFLSRSEPDGERGTRRFPLAAGFFLSLDGRASASYMRIPIAGCHASVPNLAVHLHAGLGFQYPPHAAHAEAAAP